MEKNSDGNFSKPRKLDIKYGNGYRTWHIDVIYNKEKKLFEMITCAYEDVNNKKEMNLYYTYSKDNIEWAEPITILEPSKDKKAWDNMGLYRSSLLYENNRYYLFYGAHNRKLHVGIGLMSGDEISNLRPEIKY